MTSTNDALPQPQDPNGYDSEGLVAMPDGTFWVSDEYGPFITHFDRNGRQLQRLSPFDGSLPKEALPASDPGTPQPTRLRRLNQPTICGDAPRHRQGSSARPWHSVAHSIELTRRT